MIDDNFRILLADDHALVRGGLSLLIRTAYRNAEIIETNSYDETLNRLLEDPSIDLVLMDLRMPGGHGLDSISHIIKTCPDVPLAIISVEEDIRTIREALHLGAIGYIPKTSSPDITTSAIRLMLSGGVYVPPLVLVQDDISASNGQYNAANSNIEVNSKPSTDTLGITRRQKEVLDLLVEGKPNKEIAKSLGLSPGTVKMHTSRIFKILDVSNRTEAVAKYSRLKQAQSNG